MLDKVPVKSNFEAKPLSMNLEGGETKRMVVRWSPTGEGSTRGMIRLVVNEAFRMQFVVLGCAVGSAKARKVGYFASRLFTIFGSMSWLNVVVKFSVRLLCFSINNDQIIRNRKLDVFKWTLLVDTPL